MFLGKIQIRPCRIRPYAWIWALLLLLTTLAAPAAAGEARNLVEGGAFFGRGATGDLNRLAEPRLAPEGAPWDSPQAVVLQSDQSQIVVDLGAGATIRAVVLQADHNDTYALQGSDDLQAWRTLWKAKPVYSSPSYPEMGLRTRSAVLPYPVTVRFLSIQAAGPGASRDSRLAVSRLRVYSEVPDRWPPRLDTSHPRSHTPLFPGIDFVVDGLLKSFLTTVALLLAGWALLARGAAETAGAARARKSLLLALIAVCSVAWPTFLNFQLVRPYHLHEFYHYYLGAKYTAELGYTRLYECTVVADVQDGLLEEVRSREMTDLTNDALVSPEGILANPERCLSHFGARRWEEYKSDVRWFRERYPDARKWGNARKDHGFNATPVWMIAGTALANLASPSDAYITLLSALDLLLLLAAGLTVYRCFGIEAAAFTTAFFCLNGIASYPWTGGGFLRYDWFSLLVLAICALRAGRDRLAGFALVFSALLRIFPAVVLAGIGLKALLECAAARSLRPLAGYRRLVQGALLALLLLLPLSLLVTGRASSWNEFALNSRKNFAAPAANFVGLGHLLSEKAAIGVALLPHLPGGGSADPGEEYRNTLERNRTIVHVATALLFVALLAGVARREPLWTTAVLSVGLMPFLTTLSNYYYIILALYGLLWEASPAAVFCLGILAWASWFPVSLYGLENILAEYLALTACILAFVALATALVALRRRS